MLRLASGDKPSGIPIAICRGGPWKDKIVELIEKCDAREGDEMGLIAPPKSQFFPLPEMRPALRDVLYLTAPSGAGKSTFARAYADTFLDTFSRGSRKPTIVVVCKDDPKDDPAYNKLKYVHLRPEELVVGYETPDGTTLDKPIELETFVDPDGLPTLVIFDDCEAVTDKKEGAALADLQQMLLERGRKKKVFVVFISHRAASGKATKCILQEQNAVWLPTGASTSSNLSYMLEKHLGINPEMRKAFKRNADEFGRWVFIKTDSCPRYIVSPRRVCIYDDDLIDEALKSRKILARKMTDAKVQAQVASQLSAAPIRPSGRQQLRDLASRVASRDDGSETEDDDSSID